MIIAPHFAQAIEAGLTMPAMLEQGAVHGAGMCFLERDGSQRFLSYADLCQQARLGALRLQAAGVRAGDPVIICCDDEFDLVRAFWAVLFAHGVAVPLSAPASYAAADEGLAKIIAVSRQCARGSSAAPLLISDLDPQALGRIDAWRMAMPASCLVAPQRLFAQDGATGAGRWQHSRDSDAVAMLMFSSGSTGDPKGVRLSHRQMMSNMMQLSERSAVNTTDRSLSWLPLTHDMGLVLFHLCHALAGIAQYKVTPVAFARDPAAFLDLIGTYNITLLGMPNFGFDQCLRAAATGSRAWALASVRVIYNGAEPIDPELCRSFAAAFAEYGLAPGVISPGWGIAEASVAASAFDQAQLVAMGTLPTLWVDPASLAEVGGAIRTARPGLPGAREIAALGPAMAGMAIRALDDSGRELPPSHLGHLQFSGPNVSRGYFGQADSDWCASGDIGFVHDSVVYLSGRAKDVLFINGRNHFSNDLETALCRELDWPANQLAVVGATDPDSRRERVVIFFRQTRAMEQQRQAEALRRALETLLGYPVAGAIGLAALPKTTSGKIRRFVLRQALGRGDYAHLFGATGDTVARTLRGNEGMLAGLLRAIVPGLPDALDPDLPLSRYGLDSVGFMQLAFRASGASGRTLAPHVALKAATLAGIGAALDAAPAADNAAQLRGTRVPLTARQTMLWSTWLISPTSAAYHENYWIELAGAVDPTAWQQAARTVLARHPMLCAVLEDGAEPALVLRAAPQFDIGVDSNGGAGYDHARALDAMTALGARPFDLLQGPLIRLRLLQAQNGGSYLFLSAHHIVVDGWSLHALIAEIFDACNGSAAPAQQAAELWFDQASFEPVHIAHWQQRVAQAEALELPCEIACTSNGATHLHRQLLPAALADALRAMPSSQFSLLAATLMALLSRLAGVQRPLLATVVSGRQQAGDEHRVGYYAQTVPLVADIDPHAGFDALLAQVEQQRSAILAGQTPDLAALEGETGSGIADGVRVVYVHQNMPALALPAPLAVLRQGQLRGAARSDLTVSSSWHDGALLLDWEYDSGRLGAGQIAAYAELFEHVLGAVLAMPARPLEALDLLSPAQRALWRPYQDSARTVDLDLSVVARFAMAVRAWPDGIALSDGVARYSYAQLGGHVDALCHLLAAAGLTQAQRVCLLTERSADYVIALLASLKLGAAVVPIDPSLPEARMVQIAADSGAALLLTTPGVQLPPQVAAAHRALCFTAAQLAPGPAYDGPALFADDPAYLIFTSGSTGASKGVHNTHGCLANLVDWVGAAFAYRAGETICQFAPFSFDVSIAEILPSLCAGLHIHVLPADRRNAPELYLETMRAQQVNVATVTPAYLALLNESPQLCREALGTLRLMILGGEALRTEEVRRFREHSPQVEIVNVYGPTETTVLSTAYPVPQQLDLERPWQPLGLPIANTEVWLLDEQDRVCPATCTGTLYIAGEGLGRGYWQDQSKTDAAFRMLAPGGGPLRRFYCSGDLARLTSGGLLEFVGRADNQIKLRGFRIELGEIETTLERHERIEAAVVKAVARGAGERVLVAYYSGAQLTREELDAFVRAALPAYMVPACYEFVASWPLSANRKVDRQSLPEPRWDDAGQAQDKAAPQGATEEALAAIWRELTGLAHIGRDDNFFLLGGSSLGAVRLVNRVRQQFGRALALGAVMQQPVLSEMALQIELAAAETQAAPERGAVVPEVAATEAQARMVFLDRSHPGEPLHNIPLTLALQQPLDARRLHAAAAKLAQRHPMLGAHFRLDADGVTMCFSDQAEAPFETICASSVEQAIEAVRRFQARPLDTERGPLWRLARVDVVGSERQWLALTVHHAIADGVTLMRLLTELDALYQQQQLAPMEQELSYQDYGRWLAGRLAGEFGASATRFWQAPERRAALPALPLEGGQGGEIKGREMVVNLDARQTALLQSLCRQHGCSPFALMLSLFGLVLGQRVQQQRFAIGVTLNGRSRVEFERVPGLFVNTLPLAFEWSADDRLAGLTARTKTALAALQEAEEFPLNRVMAALGQRELPFNILLNEEVLLPQLAFGGQPATLEAIGTGTGKFAMLASFLFGEQCWRWRMECREGELAPQWVDGLLDDLLKLVDALDGMADAPLGELGSLDADLLALLG